jgi:ABC-2 type transport system ATP-binding protein
MTIYLSARNISKKYGDTVALSNVNLDLHQGNILALLGPNGAGKTTFIKILATLLIKTSGTVTILGHDLDKDEHKIRHLFGYVGQDTDRSAYARLTVRENLHFFGTLRGLDHKTIASQIDKFTTFFNFEKNLDKLFMYLSGGEKQTVVIIRALLHDPPIIYLDEPTKGLDPIISKKIRTFLQSYVKQEGKTLLLTSHILSEVDEMADQVALIHHGSIEVQGSPETLKDAVGASEFIELKREKIPLALYEQIMALPAIECTLDRDPDWYSFGLSDLFEGTEAIIRLLRESNIRTQFHHHTVSLEDAFIHHVGQLNSKFEN